MRDMSLDLEWQGNRVPVISGPGATNTHNDNRKYQSGEARHLRNR